jgi:hypothetical protein
MLLFSFRIIWMDAIYVPAVEIRFHPSLNTKFDNWKNEQSGIVDKDFFEKQKVQSFVVVIGLEHPTVGAPHWVWSVCASVAPPQPN